MSEDIDPWDTALIIGQVIDGVIPVRGKRAFQTEWYNRSKNTARGINDLKKVWSGYNYAVVLSSAFVLDVDVVGWLAFIEELKVVQQVLGLSEPIEPKFLVVTGKGRFHVYCNADRRIIRSQKLTDHTQIKGFHGYVVGAGSIHPDTGKPYYICEKEGHSDPRELLQLPDEVLDRLAAKRVVSEDDSKVVFDVGKAYSTGELNHPPCIRRLMELGAPTDQDYVQANHTIARYVISAGLTDGDGAEIASQMAKATPADHPTSKDARDKIANFHSCMSSARRDPEGQQFQCSYVRGSKELIAGGLCNGCPQDESSGLEIPTDKKELIRARALHELMNGDPFDYCMKTYHMSHASDDELGKVTLLSIGNQSVLNANGLFPKATGGSGKGKTSGKRAIVHLVPPKYVFKRSFSDKALFYLEIPPESILFFDDRTLSEGMEELVRTVMDDFQIEKEHTTVTETKALTMKIPPRCMVMFTNVDSSLNLQTINRTVDVTVDESAAADEGAHKITADRGKHGVPKDPETFEVMVCREMFRIIKEEVGPFRVNVPYSDLIHWEGKENRRNFDIFLDFIRGFSAFRCMQRPTREGVVFATREDFNDAVRLWKSLSKTQTSKLNEREWLVVQALFDNGKHATIKELTEALMPHHIRYDTIYDILKGKRNKPNTGLLDKVDGLSVTKVSDHMQDPTDTGKSRSTNAELFELSEDFQIIDMYDTGQAITLSKDADDIDLNTITIWKPFESLESLGVSEAFVESRKVVYGDIEKGNLVPVSEFSSTIERYKEKLQQKNIISEEKRERGDLHDTHTHAVSHGGDVCVRSGLGLSSENVTETSWSSDNGDEKGAQIQKEGSKDDFGLRKNESETLPKLTELRRLQHTDHEYTTMFMTALMEFRMFEDRRNYPESYKTDEDVASFICRKMSEDRQLHLQDVEQAWGRVRHDPSITREMDEIFDRAHYGKDGTAI